MGVSENLARSYEESGAVLAVTAGYCFESNDCGADSSFDAGIELQL